MRVKETLDLKVKNLALVVTNAQVRLRNLENENDALEERESAEIKAMPEGQPKSDAKAAVLEVWSERRAAEREAYRELREAVKALQAELETVLTES